MLITTTFKVPGRKVKEIIGLVQGNTVRARNIGRDLTAFGRTIIGGEVTAYTELLKEAREEALRRMVKEAEAVGADAVVGLRMTTSSIMQGAAEIVAYGTAVKLEPRPESRDDGEET